MRIITAVTAILLITGCETNNDFRSKAGIESGLQGKWDKVKIPVNTDREIYEFKSGTFIHHWYQNADTLPPRRDTCTYEIIATIATPYVVIHNSKPNTYIDGRWVIIQLDGQYLVINRQENNTNGTIQREFVKM